MSARRPDEPVARAIACAIVDGFDRHYRLFSATAREAKPRFERADWHGQQRAQRERIAFYGLRVDETVARLRGEFDARELGAADWAQVKLHYIGRLAGGHLQPECAETFFNSVTTQLLDRSYSRNEFIFVRPAIATEYLENDRAGARPTYRAYYPTRRTLPECCMDMVAGFELAVPFEDLARDVDQVVAAMLRALADSRLRANFQLQVLSSLFFRNKGAYVVGKIVNGSHELPFALPILHGERGGLVIDTALVGTPELEPVFSFAHAYFMVDMEIPSAVVRFLRSLVPRKSRAELYAQVGLQKHGKNLFHRDLLSHLRHSSDKFRIAPGIEGLVMLVFDLPSFPFVFKLIRDACPPPKDTTREEVMAKYQLVKLHDRVGRMADSLEFADVALPRARFGDALLAELRAHCAGVLVDDGDELVIRHCYIERRMVPLNIYLGEADPAQLARAVVEYGNAIKDLVAANIFPGDMLWKNFGITRNGKVVFYDYDEIEYLTDCDFRRVPEPRTEEEAMSGEVWYPVHARDVFPETFAPFLLADPAVRAAFLCEHADLLDPAFWQRSKERILAGYVHDVFPYDPARRFSAQRRGDCETAAPAGPPPA